MEKKLLLSLHRSASDSEDLPRRNQRRGILCIIGSFAFCPCHIPITLGILIMLFSGTALGAFLVDNIILVGAGITLLWIAGTWYGFRQLRSTKCTIDLRKKA